jgi:hypothetical protein
MYKNYHDIFLRSSKHLKALTSSLFFSILLTGCLKLSPPSSDGERVPQSNKSPSKMVQGTINIESKKLIDLTDYLNQDFDRLVISNGKGNIFNLTFDSANKHKKIWFTKLGRTKISLIKNGETVYQGAVR